MLRKISNSWRSTRLPDVNDGVIHLDCLWHSNPLFHSLSVYFGYPRLMMFYYSAYVCISTFWYQVQDVFTHAVSHEYVQDGVFHDQH